MLYDISYIISITHTQGKFLLDKEIFYSPLPMIGLMALNFDSPINLLQQDHADHLVGQRNAPEGYAAVGAAAHAVGQAEGAADDEGQLAASVEGYFGEFRRHVFRRNQRPLHVQHEYVRSLADVAQHFFPFLLQYLPLLGFRGIIGHLFFRQRRNFHLPVRPQPLEKFIDARRQVLLFYFSNGNNMIFHQLSSFSGLACKTTVAVCSDWPRM